jgi:hypothetical protein
MTKRKAIETIKEDNCYYQKKKKKKNKKKKKITAVIFFDGHWSQWTCMYVRKQGH